MIFVGCSVDTPTSIEFISSVHGLKVIIARGLTLTLLWKGQTLINGFCKKSVLTLTTSGFYTVSIYLTSENIKMTL